MGIKVDNSKVTKEIAEQLKNICAFNAFEYVDDYLSINANCRVCKLCVKKGPAGVCEFIDEAKPKINKAEYKGIAVYIEQRNGIAHPVAWELVGKAKELAQKSNDQVYAIVVGNNISNIIDEALAYGVDKGTSD